MPLIDYAPYDIADLFITPMWEQTQSSTAQFQNCQQAYVFRYLYQLKAKYLSKPLITGSAGHIGMDVLLDPSLDIPLNDRTTAAWDAMEKYWEEIFALPAASLGNVSDKLQHGRAQSHACIQAFAINFLEDLPFEVLETEQTIRKVDDGKPYHSLLQRMAGKMDGKVRDPDDNSWLLEHKFLANIGNILWGTALDTDHQALWYLSLAIQEDPTFQGFYYNTIQKPLHRSGATWEAMKNRMVEAMCGDTDKYFALTPVILDHFAITRMMANWTKTIKRMDNLAPDNVEMNTKSCGMYDGCEYRPLCRHLVDSGNPEEVFNCPAIEMYDFTIPHEELAIVV